jgi:hypothetical protein
MKNFPLFSFSAFMAIVLLSSCTIEASKDEKDNVSFKINTEKNDNVEVKIENKEELEKALNEVGKALKNINIDVNIEDDNGKKIEPIEARDLKKILPKRIGWIKQTESSSEKSGAFGLNVAAAKATYIDDDQKIEIAIVDGGGVGQFFSKLSDWAKIEVDKEHANGGFERVSEVSGHKVIEKYDPDKEEYELVAGCYDRFLVTLKGKNVSLRKLKSAFDDIQDDLEDLK